MHLERDMTRAARGGTGGRSIGRAPPHDLMATGLKGRGVSGQTRPLRLPPPRSASIGRLLFRPYPCVCVLPFLLRPASTSTAVQKLHALMNRMHVVFSRPIDGLDPVPCQRVCPSLSSRINQQPTSRDPIRVFLTIEAHCPARRQDHIDDDGMEPMQQPAPAAQVRARGKLLHANKPPPWCANCTCACSKSKRGQRRQDCYCYFVASTSSSPTSLLILFWAGG
jgi:hypothetical protein